MKTNNTRPALVALALAVGFAACASSAAIPDASGTIHACYGAGNGNLRIIDSATDTCRGSEVAIQWNVQGPPGGGATSFYRVQGDLVMTAIGEYGTGTATCDPGDKVVGGGHLTGAVDILVGKSYPSTDGSWTVGLKPTAVDLGWYPYAVCAH